MSRMIEVKTADLIGPALDWAVGVAEGDQMETPASDVVWSKYHGAYSPSIDWSQGGPLIEKYRLEIVFSGSRSEGWECVKSWRCAEVDDTYPVGETHLIAACRAIVAAKLGDVVGVPAELVREQ